MNTTTHKTIGYLRCSTIEQNPDAFRHSILEYANAHKLGNVDFVLEQVSGTKSYKDRQLNDVIESLGSGDVLVVYALDRIGRNTQDVLSCLQAITDKGIILHTVKGGFILKNSIHSKILSTMLSLIREVERSYISERTKTALAARKASGVRLGRKPGPGKSKLDQHRPEIEALLANGSTKSFISRRFNTTPQNLHNWIRMNKITVQVAA